MIRYLLALLFLVISSHLFGQTVMISGTEKSYQGDELSFLSYADPITNQEMILGKCRVDSTGYFEFEIELETTMLAFIYLEIYKGFIFLEPGKQYEIKLPPKTPKVFEDQINPYFQESEFYIGVVNSTEDELNYLIKQFDNEYNAYIEKSFNIIRYYGSSEVDTLIEQMQEKYGSYESPFFIDYMHYKFASLRHMAYERNSNVVIRKYYMNKPLRYHNPSYMNLFNQLFSNYFYFFGKSKNGERIFSDVAKSKSVFRLKQTLSNNLALQNDTLQEMIILKSCYDEAFSNNYPFPAVKQVVDSLIILTNIPYHAQIGKNILQKITHLRNGYYPPELSFYDADSNQYKLQDFRGKYLYLNLCADYSYVCKEEFGLLKNIVKNHGDKLEVISLTPKSDFESLSAYFAEKEYNWPLYYFSEKETVEKKYNIKVYPTYYLIDPVGRLAMSPAASPNENFEWRFFKILNRRP